MKELSIEEKARRYDEAIERGKQIQNTPYTAHWDIMKDTVEHLLPELKESEDERILKIIKETLKSYNSGIISGSLSAKDYADCLAWLEKQSKNGTNDIRTTGYWNIQDIEQSPVWSKEDDAGLADALWAIQKAKTIAKDENDMGNLWYAERFLNSIKDRVQSQPKQEWKPSNEQIKALETTLYTNMSRDDERYSILSEFVAELKKLIEK